MGISQLPVLLTHMRFLYEDPPAINQVGFLYEDPSAINQVRFLYEDPPAINIAHPYEIFIWGSLSYQSDGIFI
jgi:hypothetical protein